MLEIDLYNRVTDGDPAAAYTTEAEIAIAEQLRHRLEERYLSPSPPEFPSRARSRDDH